ncbi:MAG: glyoxalase [Halioglobus sp.]
MAEAFDQIVIVVPDLESAVDEYEALLGCAAEDVSGERWFALANTVLALRQADVDSAAVAGIVLCDPAAGRDAQSIANPLELAIAVCDGRQSARLTRNTALAVDHLVLRTADADACIEFFAGQMGIRLALDKTVPEWGGRMLFFRAGKMTLEVIQSDDATPGEHFFWGIALQHCDLDLFCGELGGRGVSCSSVRDGRKPGTRVATVKSHDLGVPTLLIEPGVG